MLTFKDILSEGLAANCNREATCLEMQVSTLRVMEWEVERNLGL